MTVVRVADRVDVAVGKDSTPAWAGRAGNMLTIAQNAHAEVEGPADCQEKVELQVDDVERYGPGVPAASLG